MQPIACSTRAQIIVLACLCVLAACAVTWLRIATVKNTYTYVQNQKELNRLQQQLQSERVRWLRLTAPKKLEALASHLGLKPPKVEQILKLNSTSNKNHP